MSSGALDYTTNAAPLAWLGLDGGARLIVSLILIGGAILASLWTARRDPVAGFVVVSLGSLLASPVVWPHALLIAAPAWLYLWQQGRLRQPGRALLLGAYACTALSFIGLFGLLAMILMLAALAWLDAPEKSDG